MFVLGEYNDPSLEDLLDWINIHTPRDSSFAGEWFFVSMLPTLPENLTGKSQCQCLPRTIPNSYVFMSAKIFKLGKSRTLDVCCLYGSLTSNLFS